MKVAILHEGHAGKSEDNWLLKKLIEIENLDENNVSFYGMDTKSNFFKPNYKDYRDLVQRIESDQITGVLFVVDADFVANDSKYGGYENTLKQLSLVADDFGIAEVSQFYIFCDPATQEGNVESLLLSTLDDSKRSCIDDFLKCSNFKAKENSKAILNQIYKIAYPETPFDFEHENFKTLREELKDLLA